MNTYGDIIQCGVEEARGLVSPKWRENGIGGVINVAYNIANHVQPIAYDSWLPLLHHPHLDEETPEMEWFGPILAFYDWARTKGKVIVHCYAGGNRSRGTFGVLLVARHGMTAAEALEVTGQPGHSAWRVAIEIYASHIGG